MTRHRLGSLLAVVFLATRALPVGAATPDDREARMGSELRRLLSPFGIQVTTTKSAAPGRWRQLRIAWDRQGAAPVSAQEQPFARNTAVVGRRGVNEPPARRRSLELAADQIFLAGLDARGQLRSWSVTADPRRLRAETFDEQGHPVRASSGALTDGTGYRALVTFSVDMPDDQALSELRIYETRWSGTEFELKPVATVDLREQR